MRLAEACDSANAGACATDYATASGAAGTDVTAACEALGTYMSCVSEKIDGCDEAVGKAFDDALKSVKDQLCGESGACKDVSPCSSAMRVHFGAAFAFAAGFAALWM